MNGLHGSHLHQFVCYLELILCVEILLNMYTYMDGCSVSLQGANLSDDVDLKGSKDDLHGLLNISLDE